MIKIQTGLNLDVNCILFKCKIEDLYTHLNKTKKDGNFTKNSITNKILQLTKNLNDYKIIYAKNSDAILKRHLEFFEYLLSNKSEKIHDIIISPPDILSEIVADINSILSLGDLTDVNNNGTSNRQTKFGKLLSDKIFNYSTYRKSSFCINLYKELGLKNLACPYCNLEIISIIESNDRGKMLLSLDHFYPKSIYPYLGLSFYNLIPSCHNCNSNIKKDKNFTIETHINPYLEAFNDLYAFKLPNISFQTLRAEKVIIENLNVKPADKTPLDLEIHRRYESASMDDVNRLIKTFSDYKHYITDGKTTELKNFIYHMHGVKQYKKQILETPKSKLLRDIIKLFDIDNALSLD